jgi:hypothetical protein
VLIGKQRSVPGRILAVVLATVGVTLAGVVLARLGGAVGLWPWPLQPSSWFGVATGFALLLIVTFEMLLWARKSLRGTSLGRAKRWMKWHIWVGLVGLPVVLVHAAFGFGGPLPATTMALFLLVTFSGIWGLCLQQWLPTKILAEIPGETVASQVDTAMRFHAEVDTRAKSGEAFRLIEDLITVPPEYDELISGGAAAAVVGGRAEGPTLLTATRAEPVVVGQPAMELREFRDRDLLPYLRHGRWSGSPLAARAEADRRFTRLRDMVPREALPALERIAYLCDLRRQWDHLTRLNFWLHNWLLLHLPLSVAMTVLMLVHAVRALKYW